MKVRRMEKAPERDVLKWERITEKKEKTERMGEGEHVG